MDSKNTVKQVELKLVKIKETSFYLNTEELNSIANFDINNMKIEFGFKVDLQAENNLFILHLIVKFVYPLESSTLKIVELSTANIFEIKSINEFVFVSDNQFEDKAGILPTLLGMAIGTLRGILVAKTAGTLLDDYPLPIVNPTELCNSMKTVK
jgi:hypothetical protein